MRLIAKSSAEAVEEKIQKASDKPTGCARLIDHLLDVSESPRGVWFGISRMRSSEVVRESTTLHRRSQPRRQRIRMQLEPNVKGDGIVFASNRW